MIKFVDELTAEVYREGASRGMQKHIAHRACWLMHLLDVAAEFRDLTVLGAIDPGVPEQGRHALHISGRWTLSFTWGANLGAVEYKLERRKGR